MHHGKGAGINPQFRPGTKNSPATGRVGSTQIAEARFYDLTERIARDP